MIVPLKKQVCECESAKKLKELGFPQESLFYWVPIWGADKIDYWDVFPNRQFSNEEAWGDVYSAYTVAELGALLPDRYLPRVLKEESGKWVNFAATEEKDFFVGSEAEARAQMLVYLKQNGLV